MRRIIVGGFFLCLSVPSYAQQKDSAVTVGHNVIMLKDIVINNHLDVPDFIRRVKEDTTFYKAFKNLYILGYTSLNDIRILDKKGNTKASLYSKTQQVVQRGCRHMQVLKEQTTGDMYDADSNFNYYTAQLYASLFFSKGTVCGENNIVAGKEFSTEGKSGLEKHKEQLKMLFFNPGSKISGIPFLSGKTSVFDENMAGCYDMSIDMDNYNNALCYIFSIKVKSGKEGDVAIDSMTTWFDSNTFEVLARNYTLSYNAGVYDFNVSMEVQLTHYKEYLVPGVLRYNGNWKVLFKGRENSVFTATLFDFTE